MKRTLFILLCLSLAGCGIKPGDVSPPKGAKATDFPRTYPDPATDPAP
jgi:hypothetical protein